MFRVGNHRPSKFKLSEIASIKYIEFTDTLALILPIGLSNNPEPTIGLAYTEKKKLINWVAPRLKPRTF